jgi:hypothetical protein
MEKIEVSERNGILPDTKDDLGLNGEQVTALVKRSIEQAVSAAYDAAFRQGMEFGRDQAQSAAQKALVKTMGKIASQRAFLAGSLARETVDKESGTVEFLYANGETITVRKKRK